MTAKSLFKIILKIFGLFFLREIVSTTIILLSSIPYFTTSDAFGGSRVSGMDVLPFIVNLLALAIYVAIMYLLLFKTNQIIDKLNLDEGFIEKEFSFNLSTSLILAIALIVIGGVILVNEIPNFCRGIFSYFQEKSVTRGMTKPNYSYIVLSAVKILLGLLIIGERKRIIRFIERKQPGKEDVEAL